MDLDDFRRAVGELRRMGPVRGLVRARAGGGETSGDPDRTIKRIQGILDSTTAEERLYPALLAVPQRCLRIAEGAGVNPLEVASFFEQFQAMRDRSVRIGMGWWPAV